LPGGSIDPNDPQTPQIAFSGSPIAIGIPQTFQHGFIRPPEQAMAAAKLPLCQF
jgi:hypothetical protein